MRSRVRNELTGNREEFLAFWCCTTLEGMKIGVPVLRALHTITSYPPDLSHPVFAHYPAMKYGDGPAIKHYAMLLAPLAHKLIAETRDGEWVLISPPVRNLPSGANLLCEELLRILRQSLGVDAKIALEPLRLVDKGLSFQTDADFRTFGDYAKLDYRTRLKAQYGVDEVDFARTALRGRNVIFVNDINITGSQLRWIRSVLGSAKPRGTHVLLIVDTVARVGRQFPHLESEINGSRLSEQRELVSFLQNADLRYTGKLVARLLALGNAGLDQVLRSIDHAKRYAIVRAMFMDGSYADDFLKNKLASLGKALPYGLSAA